MKMINYRLFITVSIFIVFACGNKQETAEKASDYIEITEQQFETDSMQLGKVENKVFEDIVKCNGMLVPLPDGIAKINAPLNGIIKNIKCINGQSVDKNQPLIEISGNEIIEIQKEFAEASANNKRLKTEYDRIKLLYNEKVTSEKDFIAIETDYKISMAKYSGLKLKIESIGLNPSKIENGEFYSSYFIKAPINGIIYNSKATIGSYVDSQFELMEIINPSLLQIKLSVFANEIEKVKKGQSVRFRFAGKNEAQYAVLNSIGAAVDNETKSISCYASINKLSTAPIANSFIEGEIIIDTTTTFVLPKSALIKSSNKNYILVLNKQADGKYFFIKHQIIIGKEFNDYFEVLDNKIDGMILTKGGYNIRIDE